MDRRRRLYSLGLVACALACLMGCHAGPSTRPAFSIDASSFPRQPGTRYVMRLRYSMGYKMISTTTEITTLESVHNDLMEYLSRSIKGKQVQEMRVFAVLRDDGIYYSSAEDPPEAEPAAAAAPGAVAAPEPLHVTTNCSLLLKFPMVPDLYWEYTHPSGGACSRQVTGREKIRVPAGSYNAVRIHETREHMEGTSWYVPHIGVVKSDNAGNGMRYVKELVKFEPPR